MNKHLLMVEKAVMKFNFERGETERAEYNIWGKRFCPYCSYDLSLEE